MHEWPHRNSGTKGWKTNGASPNLGCQLLCQYLSIPSLCTYDMRAYMYDYQMEKKNVSWFSKMGWMRQIYIGDIHFTENTIFLLKYFFYLLLINR